MISRFMITNFTQVQSFKLQTAGSNNAEVGKTFWLSVEFQPLEDIELFCCPYTNNELYFI